MTEQQVVDFPKSPQLPVVDFSLPNSCYVVTALAFQFPKDKPTQVYDVRPVGIFKDETEAFEIVDIEASAYLDGADYKFIALEEIETIGLQTSLVYRSWFQFNPEIEDFELLSEEEKGPAVEAIENLLVSTAENFQIDDASLHSVGRLLEGYEL